MNHNELKKMMFKDNPDLKKEYEQLKADCGIVHDVILARVDQGLTQKELAEKCSTTQSIISRFENGNYNPSLSFLQKLADALGLELVVSLEDRAS